MSSSTKLTSRGRARGKMGEPSSLIEDILLTDEVWISAERDDQTCHYDLVDLQYSHTKIFKFRPF